MGRVDDDLQALERQLAAESAFAEFDVAPACVFELARLAQIGRIDPLRGLLQRGFDLLLPGVGQLLATRREELDAVVGEGVVRSADHHAQAQPQRAREVGYARRRQRASHQHIDPGRGETGLQGRLDHVARDARVLADQHGRLGFAGFQHPTDRVAEAQHEVRRDRRLAHGATNAVGAEIGSAHVLWVSSARIICVCLSPAIPQPTTVSRHRQSVRHRARAQCSRHAARLPARQPRWQPDAATRRAR